MKDVGRSLTHYVHAPLVPQVTGEEANRALDESVKPWTSVLPKTYELFTKASPQHQLKPFLKHIESMAASGMKDASIAARLGLSLNVLRDAMDKFDDVKYAVLGGRARGAEEVTGAQYKNATTGDVGAASAYLKGTREWSTDDKSGPLVQVNIGSERASVDLDPVRDMFKTYEDL